MKRSAQELKDIIAKAGMPHVNAALAQTKIPGAKVIPAANVLVISEGLDELLSDEELIAVLLHERSHLEREELIASGICHGFEPHHISLLRERVADRDAAEALDEMGIGREHLAAAVKKVAEALHLDFMAEGEEHPSVSERLAAIGE